MLCRQGGLTTRRRLSACPTFAPEAAARRAILRAVHTGLARVHIAMLMAASLVVCVPVLWRGAPDLSHDGGVHARWMSQFCNQLWAGEAYPRWLSDENGGLGGAAFFFYAPVPFYAGCATWPALADGDPSGWRTAGLSFAFAMLLSGITAYLWLRGLVGEQAALFGALIYLLAPYHAAIDLYARGALGEVWSFVWMPLVLWFVNRIATRERWDFQGLAVSFALLLCSHLPITLIFSPVIVLCAIRNRALLRASAALALGAGLAAVYLAPAMLTQLNVRMGDFFAGFYDYHHHWIMEPPFDAFRIAVAAVSIGTAAYVASLFRFSRFYCALGAAALFFMTPLSEPIWWLIRPLRVLQFPWRFNALLVVAAAALSALAYAHIPRPIRGLILCVCGIAILPAALTGFATHRFSDTLLREEYPYWPRSSPAPEVYETLDRFLVEHPAKSARFDPEGSAVVESWRARHVVLQVETSTGARLTLAHFFYPGWRGWIEQTKQAIAVSASQPDGFIQMDVPPGRYTLSLELEPEPPERLGVILSLVSLAVLAAGSVATAFSRATVAS
jgi:hypothetical protein